MARGAPTSDSKVRSMSSSRHWTSTWMVTSSGIRPSSMIWRWKSKSVWEAEGNPTSISLNPMSTRVWNSAACARGPWGRPAPDCRPEGRRWPTAGRRVSSPVGPGAVGQGEGTVRAGRDGRASVRRRRASPADRGAGGRSGPCGRCDFGWLLMAGAPSGLIRRWPTVAGCFIRPTKNPLADSAQEVAGERDVTFAVR